MSDPPSADLSAALPATPDRIPRRREVEHRVGLSRSAIHSRAIGSSVFSAEVVRASFSARHVAPGSMPSRSTARCWSHAAWSPTTAGQYKFRLTTIRAGSASAQRWATPLVQVDLPAP